MTITNKADWDAAQRCRAKKIYTTGSNSNNSSFQFNDGIVIANEGWSIITASGFMPDNSYGIFADIPAGDWLIESCDIGVSYWTANPGWSANHQIRVYEKLYTSGYKTAAAAGWNQTFTGQNPASIINLVPEGNVLGLEAAVFNSGASLTATTQTGLNFRIKDGVGGTVTLSPQILAHTTNQSNQSGIKFFPSIPNGVSSIDYMAGGSYAVTGTYELMILRPLFEVFLPIGTMSKKFYWDILGMQKIRDTSALVVVANCSNVDGSNNMYTTDTFSFDFSLVKA